MPVLLFRYYPRKQGPATIHDFDGDLTIELNRSSYISNAIYWGGHHSTHIADFLASYLRPEMTFADVGANIGEITLMAAKRLVKGRVLAFEPMPDTFAQLARNVELNRFKTVALFNHGLFNQDDSLSLYVKEDRPFGMVNEGVPSLFSTGVDQKALAVRLRKFDDVAVECDLKRLDVMKIDVEGAEMMVLRGGGEFHQKISSSNNCRNVRSKFPKSWLHVRGTTFLYSRIGL
ncbi:MAG TPA: FkbM family methyltransferase [Candidatus Dormibacteraeota bacterium]|nr:FkbM family methyltransferase [Candidatus Dormibacteraeota bacterium]